jgi:inorganic triphosphatase YgiF
MGIEYELKFRATPQAQAQVLASTNAPWQTIAMETTYYDTPKGSLSARRCTLRRRLENGISVCTLKTPAPGSARGEWDTQKPSIEEAYVELCKLADPSLLPLIEAEGLVVVCGARFTRRCTCLDLGDTQVEVALDEGILMGGGKEIPLCELEVELKSGSRETAAAFAQLLAKKYGLQPEEKSKFRRALDLAKEC